jgi:mono/diheme cytochrome c family protein
MANSKKNIIEDLKAHPVKIFSLIYPYVLIVGVGIGMFYYSKLDKIGMNKIPPSISDTISVVKDLTLIEPSVTPKADVMALSKNSETLIAKGKSLFTANCIACHGANGKGDGVAAASLTPKPRNFTSKEGWINGPKLSGIYKTLSEGITGSAMVAFGTLTPEDKFALAQYIRSTFVPNPPPVSKDEITDLEQTYHLAQGESNPGQIPIKDAMIFVEKEGQSKFQNIKNVLNQISLDSNNNGAEIFDKVTKNKIRALTILSSTNEWHNNEQTFIDLVVNELNEDGFNDKVHSLTDSEWDTFYNYMSKYF